MKSPEEVRLARAMIDNLYWEQSQKNAAEVRKIDAMMRLLRSECPHANKNSAPYTRWCTDCGLTWDTT